MAKTHLRYQDLLICFMVKGVLFTKERRKKNIRPSEKDNTLERKEPCSVGENLLGLTVKWSRLTLFMCF